MVFLPWEPISSDVDLAELFSTSVLLHAGDREEALLLRCSPGMEEDSAVVVYARVARPNALRMMDADAHCSIDSLSQELLPARPAQVVAIPHIAWKHPGGNRWWRTPVTVASAVVAALLVVVAHPPMTSLVALLTAGATGLVVWFLSRPWIPTRVGVQGEMDPGYTDIVEHAMQLAADRSPVPPACPYRDGGPAPTAP